MTDTERDPLRGFDLRAVVGPTASGKSALALALAERDGYELVSLDSMQVYRGLDIGTAKPTAEERARVRHHMLDLVDANTRYDVQMFLRDLSKCLDDIRARGARPLFVGGTGFYLKVVLAGLFEGPEVDRDLRAALEERARVEGSAALHAELRGIDPISAARLHRNDEKRVVRALEIFRQTGRALSAWQLEWGRVSPRETRARLIGVGLATQELDLRIAQRARAMLSAGWPAEAAEIRASPGFGPTAVQALGYREALALHDGRMEFDAAAEAISTATRRFARRQRTWYRKFAIQWIPAKTLERARDDSALEAAARALESS